MSEPETHIGKLIPIKTEDPIRYLKDKGIEFDSDDSYEVFEAGYILFKEHLFKVVDKELEMGDFTESHWEGNEIHYSTNFYNGGTYLGEILQEIVEKETT